MKRSAVVAILVSVILVVSVASYSVFVLRTGPGRPMITYSADAYVQESSMLLDAFHNQTGYPVSPPVGSGSFAAARTIGQGAPSDVFISVALSSYSNTYLQGRYSGWAVAFAADQLVLAYSNATLSNSAAKNVIAQFSSGLATNSSGLEYSAFSNLTGGKVKVGIASPSDDPAGLRGYLALEIAGYLYANGNQSFFVQMMARNHGNISSSNAAQLVPALESGNIQFLFIYKSAAISKGLQYVTLPSSVNQGDLNMSSFYGEFSYPLPGGPAYGSPILLFVSVLANSSIPSEAFAFVDFVVNNTGTMSQFGLTPLSPSALYASVTLPPQIQQLVNGGDVLYSGQV